MLIKDCDGRINFIDKNDYYLGFDTEQDCCEDFGWAVYRKGEGNRETLLTMGTDTVGINDSELLEGYTFPNNYMYEDGSFGDEYEDDYGSYVVFLAIHPTEPDVYICFTNSHNGYYYHIWDFKHNNQVINDGEI